MLVLALTAFVAAMLSKESAVILVVPLLAYRWFRSHASFTQADISRARGAALAFGVLAVLYVALWRIMTAGGVTAHGPPSDRPAWTFAELVGRSLALWIWPWPLGLDHPLTFLSRFDGGLAAVLAVGAVAPWCRRAADAACAQLRRGVRGACWSPHWRRALVTTRPAPGTSVGYRPRGCRG
jgi:hypothetical protein